MAQSEALVDVLQDTIAAFMRSSMHGLILFMKDNDLSMSQIGALFQIKRGRSNVSELGESLGVTIAAASQMIDRLVQQGLIIRLEDPEDRRAKQLALTEKARRILKGSVHARQGWLEQLAASLNAGERERVTAALRLLIERTEQLEAEGEPAR